MAITTLNGVIAGLQTPVLFVRGWASPPTGRFISTWGANVNTTLNGGIYSSTSAQVPGQLIHYDPLSGNAYLARLEVSMALQTQCMVLLCDRFWDNGGITITSTTLQTIASPTWPARDDNGSTAGTGVLLALEVSAATGANGPTISIGYTNSAGVSGRTGTNLDTTVGSSTVGMFYRIGLQSGDAGVQSVQSLTFGGTAWASGTVNLVAYRVLTWCDLPLLNYTFAVDSITGAFPRLYNGVVPWPVVGFSGTGAAGTLEGIYTETQG